MAQTPAENTARDEHDAEGQTMDQMWGDRVTGAHIEQSERVALFRDGNYGMFIHWGLYSHLGGQWQGKTFYGIGEWIMHEMKISPADYMQIAGEFNPTDFDAGEIVRVAKAAGMKWVIITAKHHEGFAMFKSAHPFNIVDATPFARDPMQELSATCRAAGLGFGFYYSHYQDWTAPGGLGGPKNYPDGTPATFEGYFRDKCYPQVQELCTNYGALDFIWFDTPGDMPKELVMELAELVQSMQPNALLCSRIGHGLGDYSCLADMQVPAANTEGLWETCDTTNDSWSYAWYDRNWKDSRQILERVVATVARGGTYLLNIGPDGSGGVPAAAAKYLKGSGDWIARHPQVIYSAGPSPWGHALPWGDVTVSEDGSTLNLVVFDWPRDGRLLLPGLRTDIASTTLVAPGGSQQLTHSRFDNWIDLQVPPAPPERPAAVIELKLNGAPEVDGTLGVHPNIPTTLLCEFAVATGADKISTHDMEKFGEWVFFTHITNWTPEARATWQVDVAEAGDYKLELSYRGGGRMTWNIETDEGARLQNEQNSTNLHAFYPFGLLTFEKPGRHTLTVSFVAGDFEKASLVSLRLSRAE